jgi:hypothetical protein
VAIGVRLVIGAVVMTMEVITVAVDMVTTRKAAMDVTVQAAGLKGTAPAIMVTQGTMEIPVITVVAGV